MSNIKSWSTTPANNSSAPPAGAPEGMAPSTVNNVIRQQMADHRTQWEDAEWFDWGHVPVFQAGQSFLVSSTATQIYTAGRRLKLYDATTIFATVVASSPAGANTLISISSAAITASLSSLAVAILNPANPTIFTLAAASSAETLAGTSNVVAVTPLSFAGNLSVTSDRGFCKFPGGLIMEWGQVACSAAGAVTVSFSPAFPTAFMSIACAATSGTPGAAAQVIGGAPTTSKFLLAVQNAGVNLNATAWWIALGK